MRGSLWTSPSMSAKKKRSWSGTSSGFQNTLLRVFAVWIALIVWSRKISFGVSRDRTSWFSRRVQFLVAHVGEVFRPVSATSTNSRSAAIMSFLAISFSCLSFSRLTPLKIVLLEGLAVETVPLSRALLFLFCPALSLALFTTFLLILSRFFLLLVRRLYHSCPSPAPLLSCRVLSSFSYSWEFCGLSDLVIVSSSH